MKIVKKYFTKQGAHNVKFMLIAKTATPGASIATLGQKQINMKQFCDFFNKESPELIKQSSNDNSPLITEDLLSKSKLYVKMRIYADKTYELLIKNPSSSTLIKALAKIEKGATLPGKETVGTINKDLMMQIAHFKMKETSARNLEATFKTICGTAQSMGIKVID